MSSTLNQHLVELLYEISDLLEQHQEGQHTVVTETLGTGRRVVRGRERECLDHYAATIESARKGG